MGGVYFSWPDCRISSVWVEYRRTNSRVGSGWVKPGSSGVIAGDSNWAAGCGVPETPAPCSFHGRIASSGVCSGVISSWTDSGIGPS